MKFMKEKEHYCFSLDECNKGSYYGRVHIPIAAKCHMGCVYCNYNISGNVDEFSYLPGVSDKVVTGEEEIKEYLQNCVREDTEIIGISGPGDPFSNSDALKAFYEVVRKDYQAKSICICTSGYKFDSVKDIFEQNNLRYITLTINSLNAETLKKIYRSINLGIISAEKLISDQIDAIKFFVSKGVRIKINTVFVPQINGDEIIEMYEKLALYSINIFNLLYLRNDEYIAQECIEPLGYNREYIKMKHQLKEKGFPLLDKCMQCKSNSCFYSSIA